MSNVSVRKTTNSAIEENKEEGEKVCAEFVNIMDAPETSSAATKKSHRNHQHQQSNRPRREFHSKTHSLNKRQVSKPFQRKCDIYVSNKSNFQVSADEFTD